MEIITSVGGEERGVPLFYVYVLFDMFLMFREWRNWV
jgi:hypothetical protein